VVLCTSTDKLYERIYAPYGPIRPVPACAWYCLGGYGGNVVMFPLRS
jgi:hypothetical protein